MQARVGRHAAGVRRHAAASAIGLAGIVVGLAGCGTATSAPASPTTPPTVTRTTIDPAVISAFMQPRIADLPTGTCRNATTPHGPTTLVLQEIGASYTELGANGVRYQGTLAEDPTTHVVTFTAAAGAPCTHQPGTYRAAVAGRTLTLQPVSDPCATRAADFASGPWTP